MSMENVARVVLALEAHDVAEEVMHFLDRSGRARVVATAGDDRQLAEAVRQLEPDAVIAQPSLVTQAAVEGSALLAVDTRESVGSLRAALDAGARGFFVWPSDREDLVRAAAITRVAPIAQGRRARVVAVHGARGGVGTTFVATHLVAAAARRGADSVLIDADPAYADVTAALGAPTEGVHTIADLLPLADELGVAHVIDALWLHEAGFRALLAPAEAGASVGATELRTVVNATSSCCDVLVLHLPRALDETAGAGLEHADTVLEVLCLDVLSFRAATRALERLEPFGLQGRIGFVVNRARRSEIAPNDVARVFGTSPLSVLPFDRRVERAQDHGHLMPARGRMARTFDRLAAAVLRTEDGDEPRIRPDA
jgi:pilus assembly protein CpaE